MARRNAPATASFASAGASTLFASSIAGDGERDHRREEEGVMAPGDGQSERDDAEDRVESDRRRAPLLIGGERPANGITSASTIQSHSVDGRRHVRSKREQAAEAMTSARSTPRSKRSSK